MRKTPATYTFTVWEILARALLLIAGTVKFSDVLPTHHKDWTSPKYFVGHTTSRLQSELGATRTVTFPRSKYSFQFRKPCFTIHWDDIQSIISQLIRDTEARAMAVHLSTELMQDRKSFSSPTIPVSWQEEEAFSAPAQVLRRVYSLMNECFHNLLNQYLLTFWIIF